VNQRVTKRERFFTLFFTQCSTELIASVGTPIVP
jgi:hypothetical protein